MPTDLGSREKGTVSATMPTIFRSRSIKIMSKGIGVFFIQKGLRRLAGKQKNHAVIVGQLAAILKTHCSFCRRIRNFDLENHLAVSLRGHSHFGLRLAGGNRREHSKN